MISSTTEQQIRSEWQRKADRINQFTEDMLHFFDTCKVEFAKYGFIECPLTDDELYILSTIDGVEVGTVFDTGSDVACGFDFDYAIQINLGEEL